MRDHVVTEYRLPGMAVTEQYVTVPLDWERPDGDCIDVFVRELVDPARAHEDLPLLTFLQGGPGSANPRPVERTGWIDEALTRYRLVMVDQRGTGNSTRLEGADLAGLSAEQGADLLACFRAPGIVRDLEHVRLTLHEGRQWTTLGQSYGGFLTFHYLSTAPEALVECYITGGVPPVGIDLNEVYQRTARHALDKTREQYRRFPQDQAILAAIADLAAAGDVTLPDGSPLSVSRVQSLGLMLGMKRGPQRLHWLLESAFARPGRLSAEFLASVLTLTGSAVNPLFWSLQESIYAEPGVAPTSWAAERAIGQREEFSTEHRPLNLYGEVACRWMFDEVTLLRPFKAAVEVLAERTEWPLLYDQERLAANEVPVAAAVYYDDMYVDSRAQLEVLGRTGNAHAWITNQHEHDGVASGTVFTHLQRMLADGDGRR